MTLILEKPILMTDPNPSLIDLELKTATRRLLNPQPELWEKWEWRNKKTSLFFANDGLGSQLILDYCPYGQIGHHLWVRETHWVWGRWVNSVSANGKPSYSFEAADQRVSFDQAPWRWDGLADKTRGNIGWIRRPSIFMLRNSSRLLLEITNIKIQRLLDITEAEALAEGIMGFTKDGSFYKYALPHLVNGIFYEPIKAMSTWVSMKRTAREAYLELFDLLHGAGTSATNPWVWCISFRKVDL